VTEQEGRGGPGIVFRVPQQMQRGLCCGYRQLDDFRFCFRFHGGRNPGLAMDTRVLPSLMLPYIVAMMSGLLTISSKVIPSKIRSM
jgi:hypothetical protein